jgi:hypothetical protein
MCKHHPFGKNVAQVNADFWSFHVLWTEPVVVAKQTCVLFHFENRGDEP